MKDYRPIACCNVIYKCITKLLAIRLQPILPHLIDQSQAAFVKGCSISDNILLMQELVRNYHRNALPKRCAVKIDLMKAYDSVDWEFLFDVMHAMDFPQKFIRWIKICVSSAMFSVVINGELEGFFKGARGLRQGDPISPYLFLFVMEGFYAMKISDGQFSYHPKCGTLSLSHLAFANDLFLLFGADCGSLSVFKSALDEFYLFSGLKPNLQKSQIFFSGLDEDLKGALLDILPIPEGHLPVRYLGVPLISSRLRYEDRAILIEKVHQRIMSWSNVLLTFGGRA